MENNNKKMPQVGTMVMYHSNVKSDARELGPHSESVEYPAMVIREGKTEGTLNLTVFVDNQGIGDSYHRASGTISRKNVPHRDHSDQNLGCWCEIEESGLVFEFDSSTITGSNLPAELLKKMTDLGFEINENHSLSDLEVMASEYDTLREGLVARGYVFDGQPIIQTLNDLMVEYERDYNLARSEGFHYNNEIAKIQEISEFFETNKLRQTIIDKLTQTGHKEAGYLEGDKTLLELQELESSYDKELENAYAAGLKKKTAKNAKLPTLTEINTALGIKAGSGSK